MAKKKTKKKKKAPEQAVRPKDFLDMIAPVAAKFNTDHFILGGRYHAALSLKSYPPVTDELALLRCVGDMGGVNLRERPDLMRLLSVECNVDEDTPVPPVLILHGTKDRTVNTTCSVALYRRLRECGKETELYLLHGADHGNAEFWTDEVNAIVDTFIRRHFA